jgi:hypothetical protein
MDANFADAIRPAAEHLARYAQDLAASTTETLYAYLGQPIVKITLGVVIIAFAAAMKDVFAPLLTAVTEASMQQVGAVENQTAALVERQAQQTAVIQEQNQTIQVALAALVKAQEQQVKQNQEKAALPKLKPEAPESFDGNPDRVMSFLTACNLYFIATKEKDEQTKVVYALSKIKGGKDNMASKWADAKRGEIFDAQIEVDEATTPEATRLANAKLPFCNWGEFITKFRAYFMLHDRADSARDQLERLEMGTDSCEHYTTMFNGYAIISGYGPEYLLRKYKEGLTKALRKKVVGIFPIATTLDEWKERSLALDREFRKENDRTKARTGDAPHKPKKKEEAKDPDAMEVDAIEMDGRKCYNCGEAGHFKAACPRPPQNQPSGNNRGRGGWRGRGRGGGRNFPNRQINATEMEEKKELSVDEINAMVNKLSDGDHEKLAKMQREREHFHTG